MIDLKGKYLVPITAFADVLSADDWIPASNEPAFEALHKLVLDLHGKWLAPGDAKAFLWEELALFCHRWNGRNGSLAAPGNEDLHRDFVATMKRAIETLPREYSVHIELPRFPDMGDFSIPLGDAVELVGEAHSFDDHKNALARALAQREPNRTVCLKIKTSGYAGMFDGSPGIADALSLAKQSAFFLIAGAAFHSGGRVRDIYARATIVTDGELPSRMTLPDGIAWFFGDLEISSNLEVPDDEACKTAVSILTAPNKKAVTPDEKIRALRFKLHRADSFFSHRDHVDFDAIAAAIEWYFDSVSTSNETLAYLGACIGLEALLGYGESTRERMDAMSHRLADRYGFLMGKTRGERERLAAKYRAVLTVRGDLVHARKRRLTDLEREHLAGAQFMLWSLIWREIHTLSAKSHTSS